MPVAKTHSQRQQAYEQLRWLLILQQIPAGQRLREAEWAVTLGVHRTSLREAFVRLEAEGLIEAGARTGYFVPRVSEADRWEVNEIRLALEGSAIDRLCRLRRNTKRHLRDLAEACDRFDQCIQEGYVLGSAEADRRFHNAIVDAAGSRRLSMLYRRAPLPLIHLEMSKSAEWMDAERRTADQHRAILRALQAGKADTAKRILQDHLLAGLESSSRTRGVGSARGKRRR
jgi:DNA-binding GntR family transcriptional regulator